MGCHFVLCILGILRIEFELSFYLYLVLSIYVTWRIIILSLSHCRRLCDEEDELSEVEPDAVPTEVRDWLALTFTRSMSNVKRRGEEKPKFRSVANAIRAGIMVDR